MKPTTITAALIAAAALFATGCKEQGSSTPTTAAPTSTAPSWVLTSAPIDPMSITDAKASAAEGDTITIRGIIGGTMEPLSSESPVFRVVDTGLYNRCVESGDDHCATPWDYCCAPSEDVAESSATVQLVNADGSPYSGDPTANLNPLDEVVLVGTVGPRPNTNILTIKATGVFRTP
ncbi:MAG: hypothetical protein RIB60_08085 [Phycisphaerales bacterium]